MEITAITSNYMYRELHGPVLKSPKITYLEGMR